MHQTVDSAVASALLATEPPIDTISNDQIERYLMAMFRRVGLGWYGIAVVVLPVLAVSLYVTASDRSRLVLWVALMVSSVVAMFVITTLLQPKTSFFAMGLPAIISGAIWGLLPHLAMPESLAGQGLLAIGYAAVLPYSVMAMAMVRRPAVLFTSSYGVVWLVGWLRNAPDHWNWTNPLLILIFPITLIALEFLWRMHRRSAIDAITSRLESKIDPLTGLLNRLALFTAADEYLVDGSPASLLLIDLDDFKLVSDLFGHDAGDQLLVAAGGRIRHASPAGALVGRVGGDEIAVFLPETETEHLLVTLDAIEAAFTQVFRLNSHAVSIDVHIGAAETEQGQSVTEMLRRADQALFEAKRQGVRTMTYSPALREQQTSAVVLRAELSRSLEDGQVVAYLQPIMDVAADRIAGFEALARWQSSDRVVEAETFIEIASAAGLLPSITRAVAADVAVFLEQIGEDAANELHVGINVDLADLGPMLDWIDRTIADPSRIIVEVTEQDDTDEVLTPELLATKLDSGIHIVLDDFGMAFSSFARVLELPVGGLKIDASFVKDMLTSHASIAVINAIASVGQAMDLAVTAEGVETREQSEALRDMGITMQQGFLHSAPLTVADAVALVVGDAAT